MSIEGGRGLIYITGGGIFDTGPGFVFNLGGGGPGIRMHQFGGGRPRRRPDTAQPAGSEPVPSLSSALKNLLPLLIVFLLPVISSFLSGTPAPQGPSFNFDAAKPPNTVERSTWRLHVPYWVNPVDVEDYTARKWKKLDEIVETKYVHTINMKCEQEHVQQTRMVQDAQGWFYPDTQKMTAARKMPMPNCKRLRELGIMY